MTPDLSCYLVLDAGICGDRLTEVAGAAVAGGAGIVQLRMKEATTAQRIATGRAVQAAIGGRALFVVNDDIEAALALSADGVHVGQGDMPAAEVRRAIGAGRLLGLSVETEAQARAVPDCVDHIGAGPVRATATKPGHAAPTGWDGLARIVAASPVPAVAIGGVTASDAPAAVRAGAMGLAVVSAICAAPDPAAAARDIAQAMRAAREVA
ncbi:thiamine phosphate synthase [Rhodovulum sp. 12E13]|uniref:thiamine phosphate synthase n=1 Tax=Rhodovulum sp. 12E13 TaxID=2203891 RepID=UPI000E188BA7|nr:thiamine phosphate synthase [Rhodovulum sp. 12E13]RDC75457.1 thiamine phosphate synthase [Rhodovulum sp. 12E13]